MLRVRFWGTRGSLAKPGPHTLRHGGNTSCVEVHAEGGEALVLDSGTGIHDLGQTLVAAGRRPVNGHLLITHTHWDHIQGFPFFTPLYAPGNTWDVYAPRVPGQSIEDVLAGQMAYTYFPITLEQLGATIRYHNIVEESFDVGPVRVSAQYVNHPAVTVGFRLEAGGATVVYATDHEPHAPHLVGAAPPAAPAHREDGRHLEFLAGADLLIHDAQFTLAEYPARVGWGHTPAEVAVDYALAAGARQLALFHHDPLRHDDALDALVALCQRRAAAAGGGSRCSRPTRARRSRCAVARRRRAATAPRPGRRGRSWTPPRRRS